MSDNELVSSVREQLHMGCVESAKEYADMIFDSVLQSEMYEVIREYEGGY